MDFIQAIIQGLVQGLTEFLPVSSSGHLVLSSYLYKYFTGKTLVGDGGQEVFFDIMLHLGTLVAVLIYFKDDLASVFKAFFYALKTKTLSVNAEARVPVYVFLGTVATIAVVFPLKDYFEADMHRPGIVGLQIVVTGVLLFATEFLATKFVKKTSKNLDWKRSLLIGVAQGFAVSPGISRSGSTIATGLVTGMDRVSSARFSFLLSIPIILLAALYDTFDLIKTGAPEAFNWPAIVIGTVISGIVGYFCIKYFIKFLSKHSLNAFGIYCVIVGLGMFFFFGTH